MIYFCLIFIFISVCKILPSLSPDEDTTLNTSSIRELLLSSHQESLQMLASSLHVSRRRRSNTPFSIRGIRFHPQPETQEVSRAGEVFHTTLQLLKNRAKQEYDRSFTASELLSCENLQLLTELSECPSAPSPELCEESRYDKYRSISGVCNNRLNPAWGAANSALVRWLPAEYEDEEGEPKGWNEERLHNGFQLPPPRRVSREILRSSCKVSEDEYSQLLVDWGQYIDHDITFTPQSSSSTAVWTDVDCYNTCENIHPCFPIQTEDSLCMPFHRSTPDCFSSSGSDTQTNLQRQQLNAITSYIDASLVYGHAAPLEGVLRNLSDLSGKLAVNNQFRDPNGRSYLPFVAKTPSGCGSDQRGERVECFRAGDSRVNEGLPLIALHTLWLREHNRVAEMLKRINDHWSPEMIYQETRKIIGAMHQVGDDSTPIKQTKKLHKLLRPKLLFTLPNGIFGSLLISLVMSMIK